MTPKKMSVSEMAKVNVELVNERQAVLRCKSCGLGWSPNLLSGGRLPRGYWKCPRGCNEEILAGRGAR